MDSSDPDIIFDEAGHCNYCSLWAKRVETETFRGNSQLTLPALVSAIKKAGRGRDYDCIIGVSGGVDSTYVASVVRQEGLRPLAVHLDNGWNLELSVYNIQTTLQKLGIDLHTHVIDWQEFRDLQLAFIRASVVNIEIPTDHAIHAVLQQMAARHRIPYIVTGGNIWSEGIYPRSWGWYNFDYRHIRAIHRRFGELRHCPTYPTLGLMRFGWNTLFKGIRTVPILNYIDYRKTKAVALLEQELGWRPYGGKHFESIFTRFYQGYILPRKFGIDKRRVHLSALVLNGEMTREQAQAELAVDPYSGQDLEGDRQFFMKKFSMSEQDFSAMMATPPQAHTDFPTHRWFFDRMPQIRSFAKRLAQGRI